MVVTTALIAIRQEKNSAYSSHDAVLLSIYDYISFNTAKDSLQFMRWLPIINSP